MSSAFSTGIKSIDSDSSCVFRLSRFIASQSTFDFAFCTYAGTGAETGDDGFSSVALRALMDLAFTNAVWAGLANCTVRGAATWMVDGIVSDLVTLTGSVIRLGWAKYDSRADTVWAFFSSPCGFESMRIRDDQISMLWTAILWIKSTTTIYLDDAQYFLSYSQKLSFVFEKVWLQ